LWRASQYKRTAGLLKSQPLGLDASDSEGLTTDKAAAYSAPPKLQGSISLSVVLLFGQLARVAL